MKALTIYREFFAAALEQFCLNAHHAISHTSEQESNSDHPESYSISSKRKVQLLSTRKYTASYCNMKVHSL